MFAQIKSNKFTNLYSQSIAKLRNDSLQLQVGHSLAMCIPEPQKHELAYKMSSLQA
jgi:hypothetical protein